MSQLNTRYLRPLLLLVCFALASLPTTLFAHSNEDLETITGAHGGKLRMAEQDHPGHPVSVNIFEMVLANGEVRMWVTDHGGNPQSTSGATGNVKLITSEGIVTVELIPGGENTLIGKDSKVNYGASVKVIATITMKGQKPLQTRFAFDATTKK